MHLIHALLIADYFMIMFDLLAHIAQLAHTVVQFRVVGDNRARVTKRTKGLLGIKGEAAQVAKGTSARALVIRPVRVRYIFDHTQPVFARDCQNWLHIAGLPIQMYWYDGAGALSNGSFEQFR